jgi:hypothetical protein
MLVVQGDEHARSTYLVVWAHEPILHEGILVLVIKRNFWLKTVAWMPFSIDVLKLHHIRLVVRENLLIWMRVPSTTSKW